MLPPVEFYEAHGHRIAYIAHDVERTATPIIFLHGLTASVRFWEAAMYSYVREHHPWYSISLPLHHPSTFPAGLNKSSIDEQLFFELLDTGIIRLVGDRPVILVGYSLGGFAVLNYAAKKPHQVRGVVSIGGFASGRARGIEQVLIQLTRGQGIRRLMFYLGWRVLQSHPLFLYLAVHFYAHDTRAMRRFRALKPTLRNIYPDVRRHDIGAMRLLFHYLINMNVLDEVQRIRMPVLIVAGDRDPIIPYRHQKKYADVLPDSLFCTIPGAGHLPFAERPELFEEKFIGWLQDLEGGRG